MSVVLIGCLFVFMGFFVYLLEAVLGMILARFPATRWAGLHLWAASGLFLDRLPEVCPADRCAHCRNWTCPRFRDSVEN